MAILPVGLVASGITTLGVIVASSLVSYMLTVIDKIGMDIKNPFPLFPLQQLVAATQSSVETQIMIKDMPNLLA